MTAKELHDLSVQRGAKAKELATLLNKEKLSDTERTEITNRRSELTGIDDRIARGTEALALASSKPVELSQQEERDINRFDLGNLLRGMAKHLKGTGNIEGIEAELAKEGEKEAREAGLTELPGVQLPRMLVRRQGREARRFAAEQARERRTSMTATGTTSTTGDQGGMTVATQPIGLLDDFYNGLVLEPYITILEDLRGNVNFPRYSKDSDPAHKTENASAGALSATTAMLQLTPHRLPAYQDISEQLLMQSSAALVTVVRNNITAQLAAMVQNGWINGSGASGQPSGILLASAYTLSTVYAGGATSNATNADGSAQVYRDWTRLRTKVAANNALAGRLAFLTNSQVIGQAFETKRGLTTPSDTVSTDSRMIIDDPATMRVAGFPVLETNSVPNSLSKGASSGILSANIFGNWQDFYGAFWSGINLELLRDATIGIQGLYRLAASVYYDGGIVRPKSFAKCIDINAP